MPPNPKLMRRIGQYIGAYLHNLYLINEPVYARAAGAFPSHGGPWFLRASWDTQIVIKGSHVGIETVEVKIGGDAGMLERK